MYPGLAMLPFVNCTCRVPGMSGALSVSPLATPVLLRFEPRIESPFYDAVYGQEQWGCERLNLSEPQVQPVYRVDPSF